MSAGDSLSPAQFPIYEVGDPEENRGGSALYTKYGPQHRVHPSRFGMQTRSGNEEPVQVAPVKEPREVDVPLSKVWGTQHYVYAPHVRNLASVPAHVIEAPEAIAWHDGTYEAQDHHRVAAAHARGDDHIRMRVTWEAKKADPA